MNFFFTTHHVAEFLCSLQGTTKVSAAKRAGADGIPESVGEGDIPTMYPKRYSYTVDTKR